jgi:hypothetical protein
MEEIMEAFLAQLGYEIETKEWNERQEQFQAPIHNAGTCYKTDMFTMRSYYWGDEEKYINQYNFECPQYDVKCNWYKYYTRGLQLFLPEEKNSYEHLCNMFIDCLNSIKSGYEIDRNGEGS